MPDNKSFHTRVRIINSCLTSVKRYWTREELIETIYERTGKRIGVRTFEGDIHDMRYNTYFNYDAPIEFSKEKGGYCYTDRDYSIDKLPLTEHDLQSLAFATSVLAQYKGITILNDFAGTIDKLINLLNSLKQTDYESQAAFVDFEKAPYSKGSEHLDVLVNAIKSNSTINLIYKRFDAADNKAHLVCPYLLKEYRNRWYLLGHVKKENKIKTFALDRISEVQAVSKEPFINAKDFSAELYFKNTIGVTYHDIKPVDVVLSFSPMQGNYIKTQHLHQTQEILTDSNKEFRIKINVVPNYELISTILSYGAEVKVVSPPSIKNKIKKMAEDTLKLYNS
ncbi:putative DNA-binding transcriptional regulator YafY [Lacibacter cauensis]|uniref:Putative DNA-binding transcriptional regulator YafY n=1 Tax=Lacibacter cauensis TaxID=510947 RepID=A0A562S9F5_9BACT|nr:WYL domain-containing protein [Lacibacter cauensis]TWI77948.1 putative DNA-binding transcriptional regulator YafY [Lacibacter cauensis]